MKTKYSKRMDNFGTSIIREMFKYAADPEIISLAGGNPAPETFPMTEFMRASEDAFKEFGTGMLAYDSTNGFLPLREIVANERMKSVGVDAEANLIQIINGSQQGIEYAGKLFIDEGDTVICEGPTYLAALNAFNSFMANVVQVPMDEEGMRMDKLEKALKANPNTKFIYTIPDFHNPSGRTMSLERRKKLVELAEKYDVFIIEDNPYIEIRYYGEKLPAVKSFDKTGKVIYLGSFSKICAPGVRLGWINASEELIAQFNKIKQASDLQPNTITQRQLTKYMQMNNMEEKIQKIIPKYKVKMDAMKIAIKREFPDFAKCSDPYGGFFIWVTLPESIDTMELFYKAVDAKVAFVPGAPHFSEKGNDNGMRLSCSSQTVENINEGIKRLGQLLKSI